MSLLAQYVGEVELLKRMFFGKCGTITAATNASPIVITSNAHGLVVNDHVQISDVVGNTAANGTFVVSAVTTNTFTLSGSTGNGAYTSGGTWNLANMEALTLKLYTNNVSPAETDVAGSYTEASFTGYSAPTINSKLSSVSAWSLPGGGVSPAAMSYVQQTFSSTSVQTCYGYFLVGANSGTVYWAEKFASAIGLTSPSTLNLTPAINLT